MSVFSNYNLERAHLKRNVDQNVTNTRKTIKKKDKLVFSSISREKKDFN